MNNSTKALEKELRGFVREHSSGWSHEDWNGLMGHLSATGFDVSDADSIGLHLERVRLYEELESRGIQGLGPKRRQALADRFGTWWELQHASEEEIAATPSLTKALAGRVRESLN